MRTALLYVLKNFVTDGVIEFVIAELGKYLKEKRDSALLPPNA